MPARSATRKTSEMTQQHPQDRPVERPDAPTYDVAATQDKWRKVWDELNPFQAADDGSKERRYALTMFPYPSEIGRAHV